jgi:F-type H+-transporting ATPase subunit c
VLNFIMPALLHLVNPLFAAAAAVDPTTYGQKAGRAIALCAGAGGGAAGAGAGIGMLFGKVIESVTRQPEMRDEISSIQWLGFALTEACFFYGLVGGFIAFFL